MDLTAVQEPIRSELDAVRAFLTEKLKSNFEMFEDISRSITKKHGKLLRPAVFLLSARTFGEVTEEHIKLAGALELVHAASLAHDDVIDSASLRRRTATIRSRWGDTIAVLYGDFLLGEAFSLLSATPIAVARRLAPPLVIQVIEGEAMQYQARHNVDLSAEEYLDIIRKKTASLFAAASQIGGAAAGAGEGALSALLEYGYSFGTAYQIIDDILDLIGSETETGKTVRTDLHSGRFTLPVILLRDARPTPGVRESILKATNSEDGPAVEKIIELAKRSGAIQAAARRAIDLLSAARDAIRVLPNNIYKRHLVEMANCHNTAALEIVQQSPTGTATTVAGSGTG